ncbi:MAG: diguanylate cyclase [Actinomycetota bacterium]|nr:diguanylate cyclase [Actinomycetota bacterium]
MDTTQAVEIAPRVWWVSSMLPDGDFQCHAYLIEQGDQSVIIDPGSALVAEEIIRKVDAVVGLRNVRWLVCSHVDPDILGALPAMVARGLHPEARIVTHWRDEALIVHSGTPLKFWRIEEHGWHLELEDRTLQFVFIPYLHFAGAFGTFDPSSGTLFSSDLFGGFSRGDALFAESIEYFEAMRAFHEHYMPSREILDHAIQELRQLPIERIAPQHGQIIAKPLISPIMELLERLECGVYLLAREDPGLAFLIAANETLHRVMDTIIKEQRFSMVALFLSQLAAETLGAEYLEFWSKYEGAVLRFEPSDGYAGQVSEPPRDVASVFNGATPPADLRMLLPLRASTGGAITGAMVLGFSEHHVIDEPTLGIVNQVLSLVEVALEREVLLRVSDMERVAWKDRAVHDPLTGLYNRASLDESLRRLLTLDEHNDRPQLVALMVDIDYFKRVNDSLGHAAGDRVLQRVAEAIAKGTRASDMAFRYGGEEFLVLLSQAGATPAVSAASAAERIRVNLSTSAGAGADVTVSVGVAVRSVGESAASLVDRADQALYRAKANGRDRVEFADAD